ncbi:sigma-70 family RNA polymerase sigma factor [bacterium]|nr:sigma-70 family RNA polymerase sigma factor [bacterium]
MLSELLREASQGLEHYLGVVDEIIEETNQFVIPLARKYSSSIHIEGNWEDWISEFYQEKLPKACLKYRIIPDAKAAGWVRRVAVRYFIVKTRKPGKIQKLLTSDEGLEEKITDNKKSALDHLIDNEETDRLFEAFKQLAPQHQQIITLRFFEQLPHSEVAKILNKTPNHCQKIQYNAIQELKQKFEQDGK